MYKGTISKYFEVKKYGFIVSGARELFFHVLNFQKGFRPVVGHQVTFDVAPGFQGKREQAINVCPTNVEPEKATEFVTGITGAMKDTGGAQ